MESYLIKDIFSLSEVNSISGLFSALKEQVNAAMKDITHMRDQSEREKTEFQCQVNDQQLEILSLKTSLVDQTKVRQCFL